MKIELRKVSTNLKFSQETTMFQAELFINDKKAGLTYNEGHGGCTCYHGINETGSKLIQQAEKFCESLPDETFEYNGITSNYKMDLEHFIDNLVEVHLDKKAFDSAIKSNKKIIIFKNGKMHATIAYKTTFPEMIEKFGKNGFRKELRRVMSNLNPGETIGNTNIAVDIFNPDTQVVTEDKEADSKIPVKKTLADFADKINNCLIIEIDGTIKSTIKFEKSFADIMKTEKGINALKNAITGYKKKFKNGERILNTNLPNIFDPKTQKVID